MTNVTPESTVLNLPRYLLVQLNLTCNLKCQHCRMWRNHTRDRTIDQHRDLRLQAVREFAELNPRGTVVSCSGEPLVEPHHYYDMCRVARESGLTSMSVLNGTLINSQAEADHLLLNGADEISMSIDHPDEAIHDQQRGMRGAWKKTTDCLRMLLDARRRLGLNRKIYVMFLISNVSYRAIGDAYELGLHQIGVDKVKLNFLQPTFALYNQKDLYWDLHTQDIDVDWLMREIDRCESKYGFEFNPRWKENVRCYADSLAKYHQDGVMCTSGPMCNSFERNIVFELNTQMRLCYHESWPSTMRYQEPGDLRKFWFAPETEAQRVKMRDCRRFCAICHTFKREPATREAAVRILGK